MLYFLYALFFISCFVLIATVLLQPGKTDAGALFTSNVSSSAFGPRGTASVLSKLTIGAACVFMLTALLISMPALQGNVSVLQSVSETPVEAPAETSPAATDTNIDANTPDTDAANTETLAPPANTVTEQTPANK
ncbi:MAG: preprotein translocase subunit SecG [Blastocatellia bacterium]